MRAWVSADSFEEEEPVYTFSCAAASNPGATETRLNRGSPSSHFIPFKCASRIIPRCVRPYRQCRTLRALRLLSVAMIMSIPGVAFAAPTLSLSATSLNFGTVQVNTTTSQSLTLSSTGTTAVTISSVTLTGTGFSFSGTNFPLTLKPRRSTTLTVQFAPTSTGPGTGTLTFESNSSAGASVTVSLSGTATSAQVSSTPAITSPAPGSVLPGSSAVFTWNSGSNVSQFQLWLGTTGQGSQNLGTYSAGSTITSSVSVNVTGLPTSGATVYAQLYWEIQGGWNVANYSALLQQLLDDRS
jgi:hypothetical protein